MPIFNRGKFNLRHRQPKVLKRLTAFFVACCLVLDPASVQADFSMPQKVIQPTRTFELPAELGTFEKVHEGTNRRTVIYLQDAHDSLEAQQNIAAAIRHFVEQYSVTKVYEEGFEGPLPTDRFFAGIQDPRIREKLSYFLMDKLRLGGAEYAHVNREKDFDLIGVDDSALHLANVAAYREAAESREANARDLGNLLNALQPLAALELPREIQEGLRLKGQLDRGEIDFLDYIRRLTALLGGAYDPLQYPFAAKLLAGTLTEMPRHADVFEELHRLEETLSRIFLTDDDVRTLYETLTQTLLLLRLNRMEVTAEEYESVRGSIHEFSTDAAARLIAGRTGRPVSFSKAWESNIQKCLRFYELAHERDGRMKRILSDYLKKNPAPVSLLVFGGFHKSAVFRMLADLDYTVYTLTPSITEINTEHQTLYKRIMSGGAYAFETPLAARTAAKPLDVMDMPETYSPERLTQVASNPAIDWNLDYEILRRELENPAVWDASLPELHRTETFDRKLGRSELREYTSAFFSGGTASWESYLKGPFKDAADEAARIDIRIQPDKHILDFDYQGSDPLAGELAVLTRRAFELLEKALSGEGLENTKKLFNRLLFENSNNMSSPLRLELTDGLPAAAARRSLVNDEFQDVTTRILVNKDFFERIAAKYRAVEKNADAPEELGVLWPLVSVLIHQLGYTALASRERFDEEIDRVWSDAVLARNLLFEQKDGSVMTGVRLVPNETGRAFLQSWYEGTAPREEAGLPDEFLFNLLSAESSYFRERQFFDRHEIARIAVREYLEPFYVRPAVASLLPGRAHDRRRYDLRRKKDGSVRIHIPDDKDNRLAVGRFGLQTEQDLRQWKKVEGFFRERGLVLVRQIGLGGYGRVYEADRVSAGKVPQTVALKVDRTTKTAAKEDGQIDNYLRMIEALIGPAAFVSAIVRLYETWPVSRKRTAQTMAYVDGWDLGELLDITYTNEEFYSIDAGRPRAVEKESLLTWLMRFGKAVKTAPARVPQAVFTRPLSLAETAALLADILLGVEKTHAGNLTNNDIKLPNIMLTRSGQLKFVDLDPFHVHTMAPPAMAKQQDFVFLSKTVILPLLLKAGRDKRVSFSSLNADFSTVLESTGLSPRDDEESFRQYFRENWQFDGISEEAREQFIEVFSNIYFHSRRNQYGHEPDRLRRDINQLIALKHLHFERDMLLAGKNPYDLAFPEASGRSEQRVSETDVDRFEILMGERMKHQKWRLSPRFEKTTDPLGRVHTQRDAFISFEGQQVGRMVYIRVGRWVFLDERLKPAAEEVLSGLEESLRRHIIYLHDMNSSVADFDHNLAPFAAAMTAAVDTLDIRGRTVLDLGSGSGVLSLIAYRKGARAVLVDYDAEEEKVFRAHLKANGMPERDFMFIQGDINDAETVISQLPPDEIYAVFANIGEHPVYPSGTHLSAVDFLQYLPFARYYLLGGYGLGFESDWSGELEQDAAFYEAVDKLEGYGFIEKGRVENVMPGVHAADAGIKTVVIAERSELRTPAQEFLDYARDSLHAHNLSQAVRFYNETPQQTERRRSTILDENEAAWEILLQAGLQNPEHDAALEALFFELFEVALDRELEEMPLKALLAAGNRQPRIWRDVQGGVEYRLRAAVEAWLSENEGVSYEDVWRTARGLYPVFEKLFLFNLSRESLANVRFRVLGIVNGFRRTQVVRDWQPSDTRSVYEISGQYVEVEPDTELRHQVRIRITNPRSNSAAYPLLEGVFDQTLAAAFLEEIRYVNNLLERWPFKFLDSRFRISHMKAAVISLVSAAASLLLGPLAGMIGAAVEIAVWSAAVILWAGVFRIKAQTEQRVADFADMIQERAGAWKVIPSSELSQATERSEQRVPVYLRQKMPEHIMPVRDLDRHVLVPAFQPAAGSEIILLAKKEWKAILSAAAEIMQAQAASGNFAQTDVPSPREARIWLSAYFYGLHRLVDAPGFPESTAGLVTFTSGIPDAALRNLAERTLADALNNFLSDRSEMRTQEPAETSFTAGELLFIDLLKLFQDSVFPQYAEDRGDPQDTRDGKFLPSEPVMAAQLLKKVIRGGEHVIDLGSGSGTILFLALGLGAGYATGFETDADLNENASGIFAGLAEAEAFGENFDPSRLQILNRSFLDADLSNINQELGIPSVPNIYYYFDVGSAAELEDPEKFAAHIKRLPPGSLLVLHFRNYLDDNDLAGLELVEKISHHRSASYIYRVPERSEQRSVLTAVSDEESRRVLAQSEIHGSPVEGRRLTQEEILDAGLEPRYRIELDGRTIYLSGAVFPVGDSGRLAAYLFVEQDRVPGQEPVYVVRSFYRSNSQGGTWRYLPSVYLIHGRIHWYHKGHSEDSLPAPYPVQEALNQIRFENGLREISTSEQVRLFAGTTHFYTEAQEDRKREGDTYMSVVDSRGLVINEDSHTGVDFGSKTPPDKVKLDRPEQGPDFDRLIHSYIVETGLDSDFMPDRIRVINSAGEQVEHREPIQKTIDESAGHYESDLDGGILLTRNAQTGRVHLVSNGDEYDYEIKLDWREGGIRVIQSGADFLFTPERNLEGGFVFKQLGGAAHVFDAKGQLTAILDSDGSRMELDYGLATARVFNSIDGQLQYVFITDKQKQSMIASIEQLNSPVNRIGIRTAWVRAGSFVTPIYEYVQMAGGYGDGTFNGKYTGMWRNYLRHVSLIQEFDRRFIGGIDFDDLEPLSGELSKSDDISPADGLTQTLWDYQMERDREHLKKQPEPDYPYEDRDGAAAMAVLRLSNTYYDVELKPYGAFSLALRGTNTSTIIPFDQIQKDYRIVLGRRGNLEAADAGVSRVHAEVGFVIEELPGTTDLEIKAYVRDLGSSNGTWADDALVDFESRLLLARNVIKRPKSYRARSEMRSPEERTPSAVENVFIRIRETKTRVQELDGEDRHNELMQLLEMFAQPNLQIRKALVTTLKDLRTETLPVFAEYFRRVPKYDAGQEAFAAVIVAAGYLYREDSRETRDEAAELIKPLFDRVPGREASVYKALRYLHTDSTRDFLLARLADAEAKDRFALFSQIGFTGDEAYILPVFESAVREHGRRDLEINQIPYVLSYLMKPEWIAQHLEDRNVVRAAFRFGFIDEVIYHRLLSDNTAEIHADAAAILESAGFVSAAVLKAYQNEEPAYRSDLLRVWRQWMMEFTMSFEMERIYDQQKIIPLDTGETEEARGKRDIFFAALREHDLQNVEEKLNVNPFDRKGNQRIAGRYFFIAHERFADLYQMALKEADTVFDEAGVDADLRGLLKPFYASSFLIRESQPLNEARQNEEAIFRSRWKTIASILTIRKNPEGDDVLMFKPRIWSVLDALYPNVFAQRVAVEDRDAVTQLVSRLSDRRYGKALMYGVLDGETVWKTHLFMGQAEQEAGWQELSWGGRAALKLFVYDLFASNSTHNFVSVQALFQPQYKRLLEAERRARKRLPSLGMELQTTDMVRDRIYAWKEALEFFGIPSPYRPEYYNIVEAAFPPAWSSESFLLAIPLLLKLGYHHTGQKESAFHISLAGNLGKDAKYLAFPLLAFRTEVDSVKNEHDWITSQTRVMSKGLIHLNHASVSPAPDAESPGVHTELRTGRLEYLDKESRILDTAYEVYLPGVQALAAALTASLKDADVRTDGEARLAAIWSDYQRQLEGLYRDEKYRTAELLDADWFESTGDPEDAVFLRQLPIMQVRLRLRDFYRSQDESLAYELRAQVRDIFIRFASQAREVLAEEPRSELRAAGGEDTDFNDAWTREWADHNQVSILGEGFDEERAAITEFFREFFEDLLRHNPAARIADLGTGRFFVPQIALEAAAGIAGSAPELHGVDYVAPAAGTAPAAAKVHFHQGDMSHLEGFFEPESLDGATSSYGIEYTLDPAETLRSLGQVMKPGAETAMVIHHADSIITHSIRERLAQILMIQSHDALGAVRNHLTDGTSDSADAVINAFSALKSFVDTAGEHDTVIVQEIIDLMEPLLMAGDDALPAIERMEAELNELARFFRRFLETAGRYGTEDSETLKSYFTAAGFDAVLLEPFYVQNSAHPEPLLIGWKVLAVRRFGGEEEAPKYPDIEILRGGRQTVPHEEDDLVDVLDEEGRPTGVVKKKSEVHRDGDWHRSVHLYVLDEDGRLLLQKRSLDKRAAPGKFQVSVSGHVNAGETSFQAVLREAEEELGLLSVIGEINPPLDVTEIKRSYVAGSGDINNEFTDVYVMWIMREHLKDLRYSYNLNEIDSLAVYRTGTVLLEHAASQPGFYSRSIHHALENGILQRVYEAAGFPQEDSRIAGTPADFIEEARGLINVLNEENRKHGFADVDQNDGLPEIYERYGIAFPDMTRPSFAELLYYAMMHPNFVVSRAAAMTLYEYVLARGHQDPDLLERVLDELSNPGISLERYGAPSLTKIQEERKQNFDRARAMNGKRAAILGAMYLLQRHNNMEGLLEPETRNAIDLFELLRRRLSKEFRSFKGDWEERVHEWIRHVKAHPQEVLTSEESMLLTDVIGLQMLRGIDRVLTKKKEKRILYLYIEGMIHDLFLYESEPLPWTLNAFFRGTAKAFIRAETGIRRNWLLQWRVGRTFKRLRNYPGRSELRLNSSDAERLPPALVLVEALNQQLRERERMRPETLEARVLAGVEGTVSFIYRLLIEGRLAPSVTADFLLTLDGPLLEKYHRVLSETMRQLALEDPDGRLAFEDALFERFGVVSNPQPVEEVLKRRSGRLPAFKKFGGRFREVPYAAVRGSMIKALEDARVLAIFPDYQAQPEMELVKSSHVYDAVTFAVFYERLVGGKRSLIISHIQSDAYNDLRQDEDLKKQYQDWRWVLRAGLEDYAAANGITQILSPVSGTVREHWKSIPEELARLAYDTKMSRFGYEEKVFTEPVAWDGGVQAEKWWVKSVEPYRSEQRYADIEGLLQTPVRRGTLTLPAAALGEMSEAMREELVTAVAGQKNIKLILYGDSIDLSDTARFYRDQLTALENVTAVAAPRDEALDAWGLPGSVAVDLVTGETEPADYIPGKRIRELKHVRLREIGDVLTARLVATIPQEQLFWLREENGFIEVLPGYRSELQAYAARQAIAWSA